MVERYLLDTGFLIALVNAVDPDHARCVEVWSSVRGELLTVEGVLVESAHMLRRTAGGFEAAFALVQATETEIVAPTPARYARALSLMRKYRDVPMDLVDALLVALAEERQVKSVLTLDRRGFLTYRLHGKRKFQPLPCER